jgi:hypothetical protein
MLPIVTGYAWNESAGRYVNLDTGRFISSSAVRDALESAMDVAALRMNAVSQQLIDGEISLAGWQTEMLSQIKISHVAAGAAAGGGWAQMSQSDWGAVGQLVREQYDFLRRFAGQIADGTQPLDGRLLVRSDMYGDAARGTYEAMRTRMMIAAGYEEEGWELDPGADHCSGCLEQAGMGWVAIGELDDIGSQDCQVRCRCTKIYRRRDERGEWEESE